MADVTGRLMRSEMQEWIEVDIPGVGKKHLWDTIIAHCAKDLSPNELKKVLADCEAQLRELGPDNTPLKFQEMFDDLKKAMLDRGIKINDPPPLTDEDKKFFKSLGLIDEKEA